MTGPVLSPGARRTQSHFLSEVIVGRKRRPTSPANPLYGYPAELIAEWCGVSIGTAEHCKAGRRKAPTPVLRLWRIRRIHRDRRVLSHGAWDGFRVITNQILAPGDSRPMNPEHFYLRGLVWQAACGIAPYKYHKLPEEAANSQPSALLQSGHSGAPKFIKSNLRFRPESVI